MRKIILGGIVALSSLSTINAQFPYNNPLKNKTNITSVTNANADYGMPIVVEEGLQLTNKTDQGVGFGLDNLNFSTTRGFVIDFVFTMYQDASIASFAPGNGFTFVLSSNSNNSITMGYGGPGLGYTYNMGNNMGAGLQQGFNNAYLGIGFDIIGTFKAQITDLSSTNYRSYVWRCGIPGLSTTALNSGSDITIRGPYNASYTPISGGSIYNSGYPVITSINTNGATPNKYDLDGTTRNYVTSQKDFTPFKLQSDYYTADPNDSEYRRAIISLIPGKDDSGDDGFYLNLNVYHGAILTSIIKDYFISNSQSVNYNDVARATVSSATSPSTATPYPTQVSLKPPTSLHISFVGGTSPTTAIKQSISNINITLPYSPNLPDASADDICKTLNNSSSFSVLDDALGYNNNIYTTTNPPIGRRSYIDLTSFWFQTYDSATGQYTYTDSPYICTTNAGKYTYNPSTGNIIFVPSAGAASLDQDFIYYNIKNKKPTDTSLDVLSTDEYRSRTAKATINLTSTDCQPMPNVYVKINK